MTSQFLNQLITFINTLSLSLQQANTIILVIVLVVFIMGFKVVWDGLSGK